MKMQRTGIIDLAKLNAKLQRWQRKHDTTAKVAAAHRKVLLERVVQSMAFENEAVSMARLKTLLKRKRIAGKKVNEMPNSRRGEAVPRPG